MDHEAQLDRAARGAQRALCGMLVACGSASSMSDDGAQREPEQTHERDAGSLDESAAKTIAPECVGRAADQAFCDGSVMRSCIAGVPSMVQRCDERERCVTIAGNARCACEPGTIDTGSGCEAAVSCATAGGGCDPLTTCSIVSGARKCGACPAGYAGDGERGCEPTLSALAADGGELMPAFSPDAHSYRVKLPSARQQISFSPAGPPGVLIEVNAAKLSPGATWTSEVLSPGAHTITLQLTARTGISAHYEVIVERSVEQ